MPPTRCWAAPGHRDAVRSFHVLDHQFRRLAALAGEVVDTVATGGIDGQAQFLAALQRELERELDDLVFRDRADLRDNVAQSSGGPRR